MTLHLALSHRRSINTKVFVNPANFSQSRQNYINNFTLKNIASGKESKVILLPSILTSFHDGIFHLTFLEKILLPAPIGLFILFLQSGIGY